MLVHLIAISFKIIIGVIVYMPIWAIPVAVLDIVWLDKDIADKVAIVASLVFFAEVMMSAIV